MTRRGVHELRLAIARCAICVMRLSRLARMVRAEQAAFRSRVEVVEVDVAVTRGGATVSGLTASNFVVTDNGVTQDVTAALLGAEPLRVTMVLDVSKSVSGSRLASLIKAGSGMVRALGPSDQASLITFSHQVALRVPMSSRFGRDRERPRRADRHRRHGASRCRLPGTSQRLR